MRHAGAGLGEFLDFPVVEEDGMREPDVRAEPADRLGEIDGTHAVDLGAIRLFVQVLGKMEADSMAIAKD